MQIIGDEVKEGIEDQIIVDFVDFVYPLALIMEGNKVWRVLS